MWDNSFREAIKSGSAEQIVAFLQAYSESAPTDSAMSREIVELLRTTPDPRIRNAAAIALADTDRKRAAEVILKLLEREEVRRNAGSLLFALEETGKKLPVSLVVAILRDGSFEAREECLMALEEGRVSAKRSEIRKTADELRKLHQSYGSSYFEFAAHLVNRLDIGDREMEH